MKICVAKTACMAVTEPHPLATHVKSVNMEINAQSHAPVVVATKDAKLKMETVGAV